MSLPVSMEHILKTRTLPKWSWAVLFVCCCTTLISALRARHRYLSYRLTQNSTCSVPIPYKALPEDLPECLPTIDQIEKSEEVLLDRLGAKVVVVGSHFVVKYGRAINLEEGRTMIFAADNTSVSVPRVYALFSDTETKKNYIVMERIHGKNLQDEWNSLNSLEKKTIMAEIGEQIHTLRGIRSNVFCSVGNKPLRDGVFWTADKTLNLAGPFDSESKLNNAIVEVYKCSKSTMVRRKAGYCEQVFLSELRGHKPVFTHGDLQRKNIMLRDEFGSKKSVIILDWETAGFYPEYWEYSRAYRAVRFQDDWEIYLRDMLESFPRECNMLHVVFDDLSC